MKAVKKPVEIDYFPVVADGEKDNVKEIKAWVESLGDSWDEWFILVDQGPDGAALKIKTLEGTSYDVTPEDVIIRGIKGEYYPCKVDIFEKTYDKL